jgi:hypothetical protein
MRALGVLLLLCACAAHPTAQQTPVRDPRAAATAASAAPTGTGAIAGAVTAGDGRPIRFANVLLLGAATGIVKITSSNADGKFSFTNLPVDRYTIGVSKQPYLATVAGAKRPGRPGTSIVVAAGQKVTDVAIRMSTGGAITGVITDERGQPGSGALIGVMQWRLQGSERVLVQVGGLATTDDEGRYRVFGLVPGEYVITAMRSSGPPARVLSVSEVDAALRGTVASPTAPAIPVRYAPVYFPGTTRATEAVPIPVNAGEERNNADFRLEAVPTSRIEGSIVSTDGQPLGGVDVTMTSVAGSVMQFGMRMRVGPDGRFGVGGAMPGSYVILANGSGPTAGQFAYGTVEIGGGDVLGIQLTMKPALTINGRLIFDSATAPGLAGRRIPVRALSPASAGGNVSVAATSQTGAFAVTGLIPGRYVLGGPLSFGPTADTMTWTLQSVVADGRDVTDLPLEIADSAPKDIVVTYTDKWQELSGRLQSQSGAPVSDYTIIVFPEDKAYWFQGTRRIVTARPGTDGRFTLSGKGLTTLPPGKYLLAAVTDIGRDEQFDPALLAQVVPAAVPVTLGPGEKKIQDLAIR